MDYAACNVVYVDRAAQSDRLVRKEDVATEDHDCTPADSNLRTLLGTFSEVYVCASGKSCISKLSELNHASIVELIPTLVLIDIPYDDTDESPQERTPSPNTRDQKGAEYENADPYGLRLLQWVASEIQYQSLSRLVVPVAVVRVPDSLPTIEHTDSSPGALLDHAVFAGKTSGVVVHLDQARTTRYLDNGATDVLTSPLLRDRLPSLAIHAYKAHQDTSKQQRALLEMRRGRKRSWVGVDDEKPYAYLREAMVSGLMDGICKLEDDEEPVSNARIKVDSNRKKKVVEAVASWGFSAHDFTDDELLYAASLMLQHALDIPELEEWRIPADNMTTFLVACRQAYNTFVPYHNFRHVVDVLQACFCFLVHLGRLPPFPAPEQVPVSTDPSIAPSFSTSATEARESQQIADIIRPFDALVLLITAIGHDVGHPGVNNAFLVTLNAPLAQLYNDRSVLESFHCAAYSQILRRHWPAVFRSTEMRKLMISSILATDMQLHFDYMKRLGWMQEKLHDNPDLAKWTSRETEEHRSLACALIIKCADISNVARKYDVAAKWTYILTHEFARQASMETELGIPTALFSPPVREIVALGKSQIGFINMFAGPLFQGVADVMPGMKFTIEELDCNKDIWLAKMEEGKTRQDSEDSLTKDGAFSPRTQSVTNSDGGSSATDIRKQLLARKATNGTLDESYQKSPEVNVAPSISSAETITEGRSKPSQLHLSFATASATINGVQPNGVIVSPSLVTDPVLSPPSPGLPIIEPERTPPSNGTETSNDWTSQATSATTSKMPLSPSTQGTSVSSDSLRNSASVEPAMTTTTTMHTQPSEEGMHDGSEASTVLDIKDGEVQVEKTRGLKKKTSRFRMNFWKRNKSGSPPQLPVGGHDRAGDESVSS